MLTLDDARTILRNESVRLTPQRLMVTKVLLENREHPTVERLLENILEKYPTVSLATVYSTVTLLARYGLISLLHGGKDGMRLDSDTTPHAHAHCVQCGLVLNVPINQQASVDNHALEGFQQARMETAIFGYCPKCAQLSRDESLA